jgi:peptide/nickel transport system permease protein
VALEDARSPLAAPLAPSHAAGLALTWGRALIGFGRHRTLGAAGGVVIVAMILVAIFASIIAPYDPKDTSFLEQLKPPSAQHWLGTDTFGRDVLSRLIYGARTALLIGFFSAFVGCSLGALLGVISAYYGGKIDLTLERLMDVIISFPVLILALAVVSALGNSITNVIIAITVPIVPRVARVIRSGALSLRQMPFVEAARGLGARDVRIILSHMLPNVIAPYLILLTAFLGQAILAEAALSFLGLGVSEPEPAWGLMLRGASVQFVERAPWLAIAPGVAISLAVFAFNLLGDSLRDALDPRLRL